MIRRLREIRLEIRHGEAMRARATEDKTVVVVVASYRSVSRNQSPCSFSRCTFQFLGGCQGRRTGVGVTTVSNSLILGGWVTKVLKNDDET